MPATKRQCDDEPQYTIYMPRRHCDGKPRWGVKIILKACILVPSPTIPFTANILFINTSGDYHYDIFTQMPDEGIWSLLQIIQT
jgi:hypothetical protein